ncbi:hypothetical protein QJQ45_018830 [Haematococcus lacustris]|nr:hypothetical protein QJQ45_018830 [Haematococcus lacustris]
MWPAAQNVRDEVHALAASCAHAPRTADSGHESDELPLAQRPRGDEGEGVGEEEALEDEGEGEAGEGEGEEDEGEEGEGSEEEEMEGEEEEEEKEKQKQRPAKKRARKGGKQVPDEFSKILLAQYKHHAPNADKPFSVLGKYEYTIPGCVPGEYPKLGSNAVEARWNVPMRAIIGLVWKEFTKANPAYLALLSYWMLLAAFKKSYDWVRRPTTPKQLARVPRTPRKTAEIQKTDEGWETKFGCRLLEAKAAAVAAGTPFSNDDVVPTDMEPYLPLAAQLKAASENWKKPDQTPEGKHPEAAKAWKAMSQTFYDQFDEVALDLARSIPGGSNADPLTTKTRLVEHKSKLVLELQAASGAGQQAGPASPPRQGGKAAAKKRRAGREAGAGAEELAAALQAGLAAGAAVATGAAAGAAGTGTGAGPTGGGAKAAAEAGQGKRQSRVRSRSGNRGRGRAGAGAVAGSRAGAGAVVAAGAVGAARAVAGAAGAAGAVAGAGPVAPTTAGAEAGAGPVAPGTARAEAEAEAGAVAEAVAAAAAGVDAAVAAAAARTFLSPSQLATSLLYNTPSTNAMYVLYIATSRTANAVDEQRLSLTARMPLATAGLMVTLLPLAPFSLPPSLPNPTTSTFESATYLPSSPPPLPSPLPHPMAPSSPWRSSMEWAVWSGQPGAGSLERAAWSGQPGAGSLEPSLAQPSLA